MKKLDLGQSIGILANVGVIAGIAFLAVEIHQNNELLEEQARYGMLENQKASTYFITQTPELARLVYGAPDINVLTEVDQYRRKEILSTLLFMWQWEFERGTSGRFSENQIPVEGYRAGWEWYDLDNVWNELKPQYSTEFASFIDDRIAH